MLLPLFNRALKNYEIMHSILYPDWFTQREVKVTIEAMEDSLLFCLQYTSGKYTNIFYVSICIESYRDRS